MTYTPRIYINGVHLAGAKVYEDRDMSGLWVSAVQITAPEFEVKRKESEE